MRCEIVHDRESWERLGPAWTSLVDGSSAGLFLSHRWLTAWWRAFHGVDDLWLFVVHDGEQLVGGWPLHLRAPRAGGSRVSELRVLGELGHAGRSLLCRPELLDDVVEQLVDRLVVERSWDTLDVPFGHRRTLEAFARTLGRRNIRFVEDEVPGRPFVDLPGDDVGLQRKSLRPLPGVRVEQIRDGRRGIDELLGLLRRQWAARETTNPSVDVEVVRFLDDVVPGLLRDGLARLGLCFEGSKPRAANLTVIDGAHQVELLRGADPGLPEAGAEVAWAAVEAAVRDGARRFEFAAGEAEPPLPTATATTPRLRAWNGTTRGQLSRRVEALKDVASTVRDQAKLGPLAQKALDRLRDATPANWSRAIQKVASYSTLHLYRGELFVRDGGGTPALEMRLLTRAEVEALSDADRDELVARLDLQLTYCRQKWDRGDLVVLASVDGRPSGIVWCARAAVYVPDIGREVRPQSGECYIHDVYVNPDTRGRQVAPAMLDFLASELRARDVYRAWALIERTNVASTRAFEKAAYASVADVLYARMGLASRLIVRPDDPEARALLGL